MASIQAAGSAEAYYEKNKGVVSEVKKAAEGLLANSSSSVEGQKKSEIQIAGIINYRSHMFPGPLIYSAQKDWAGEPLKPYPQFIADKGEFVHASSDEGVVQSAMGAVVYQTSKSDAGWLLAWSVFGLGSGNRVYVESGPVENLTKWDEVQKKLLASDSRCYFIDSQNGREMYAEIDPAGPKAKLVAFYNKYL